MYTKHHVMYRRHTPPYPCPQAVWHVHVEVVAVLVEAKVTRDRDRHRIIIRLEEMGGGLAIGRTGVGGGRGEAAQLRPH